jgi:hypothetical protein
VSEASILALVAMVCVSGLVILAMFLDRFLSGRATNESVEFRTGSPNPKPGRK